MVLAVIAARSRQAQGVGSPVGLVTGGTPSLRVTSHCGSRLPACATGSAGHAGGKASGATIAIDGVAVPAPRRPPRTIQGPGTAGGRLPATRGVRATTNH